MTEKSLPWDGVVTGDALTYAPLDQEEWAAAWGAMFGSGFSGAENNGVLDEYLNELAVTGASSPVAVDTGGALVHGTLYLNSASVSITVASPSANTRTDRIVLRKSWSAKTVRAVLLQNGSEGTGTPPALTQTDETTWEIPLATLSITTGGTVTLTDTREWIHIGGDRSRTVMVPAAGGYNVTDTAAIVHEDARGVTLTDAKHCKAFGQFALPADWISGLSVKAVVYTGGGVTGDFYGDLVVEYGACGEAPDTHSDSVGAGTVAIATASRNNCILQVTPASLAAGDIISFTLERDATNAADTLNSSNVNCAGFLVTYTADS
jgi:hypothetical protein